MARFPIDSRLQRQVSLIFGRQSEQHNDYWFSRLALNWVPEQFNSKMAGLEKLEREKIISSCVMAQWKRETMVMNLYWDVVSSRWSCCCGCWCRFACLLFGAPLIKNWTAKTKPIKMSRRMSYRWQTNNSSSSICCHLVINLRFGCASWRDKWIAELPDKIARQWTWSEL